MRIRRARRGSPLVRLGVAGCGGGGRPAPRHAADPNAPEVKPAGDIPDNQAFVAYTPAGAGFTVKVPEGWSRSARRRRRRSFTDKLNAIRIEAGRRGAPLTVREARKAELPKLAQPSAASSPGASRSSAARPAPPSASTYLADAPRRRGDRQGRAPTRSSATSSSTTAARSS